MSKDGLTWGRPWKLYKLPSHHLTLWFQGSLSLKGTCRDRSGWLKVLADPIQALLPSTGFVPILRQRPKFSAWFKKPHVVRTPLVSLASRPTSLCSLGWAHGHRTLAHAAASADLPSSTLLTHLTPVHPSEPDSRRVRPCLSLQSTYCAFSLCLYIHYRIYLINV